MKYHMKSLPLFIATCFVCLQSSFANDANLPDLAKIRIAAEQGDAVAQFKLAEHFLFPSHDAEVWYRKAAEQGLADAQYKLGMCLLMPVAWQDGKKSRLRKESHAEASDWFQKASDQGNADAMVQLGRLYQDGSGVVKDIPEAYKYYMLALNKGGFAAKLLGKTYSDQLILKMTPDEIREGQKRFEAATSKSSAGK